MKGGGRKMALSRSQRFPQVSSTEDEEAIVQETRSQGQNSMRTDGTIEGKRKRRRKVRLYEDNDEDKKETKRKRKKMKPNNVKPVGEPVNVTGRGRGRRTHYGQFEYNGRRYKLEDSVLVNQGDNSPMPYIAIIKELTQKQDGRMMILGQWFYRHYEAKKEGGGTWEANDERELFYSFHCGEVHAESVMHRCVVNFFPAHKQLPKRRDNPGFIVQKVYDTDEKKLRKLTDKDYEVAKQREIDLLVEKSMSRMGDLPDLETGEVLDRGKST